MTPLEIQAPLRKQPFQPIRLFVSDGSFYDVRHPECMIVTRREVTIGLDPGDEGIPERSVYLDPLHITRIEPINGDEAS